MTEENTPMSTEEGKNGAVPTHHSPAPWELYPAVEFPEHAFAVRDAEGNDVAYIAYNPEKGIRPLDLADAALIISAPRLLTTVQELFQGFLFLAGHVAFEPGASGAYETDQLIVSTRKLLTDLRKAGVL